MTTYFVIGHRRYYFWPGEPNGMRLITGRPLRRVLRPGYVRRGRG